MPSKNEKYIIAFRLTKDITPTDVLSNPPPPPQI